MNNEETQENKTSLEALETIVKDVVIPEIKKQIEPNPVGRPTVMTPEVIAKLEEAFSVGATDKEACFVANISPNSLYDYIQINPEFGNRKDALKDMPKYKAKKNIVGKIDTGNVEVSQWYAERKIKDEFSTRAEHTGANGKDLINGLSEEQKAKLDDLLK